jgi:hypothetical protein
MAALSRAVRECGAGGVERCSAGAEVRRRSRLRFLKLSEFIKSNFPFADDSRKAVTAEAGLTENITAWSSTSFAFHWQLLNTRVSELFVPSFPLLHRGETIGKRIGKRIPTLQLPMLALLRTSAQRAGRSYIAGRRVLGSRCARYP